MRLAFKRKQRIKTDSNGSELIQTDKLIHKELTYKIIGILFKVHSSLGCGFPEKIYQRSIEIELEKEKIPYQTEKEFKVQYEGKEVGRFRLDLIIDDKVIVELKAVEKLPKVFKEQLISQLKASPYEVGLLVNFGGPKLV
ncbi:MAG: GxxExxY protein [Proteobacteria bacterium]|nr:GxxExxY protein [Pseudomonadota bacterium]